MSRLKDIMIDAQATAQCLIHGEGYTYRMFISTMKEDHPACPSDYFDTLWNEEMKERWEKNSKPQRFNEVKTQVILYLCLLRDRWRHGLFSIL